MLGYVRPTAYVYIIVYVVVRSTAAYSPDSTAAYVLMLVPCFYSVIAVWHFGKRCLEQRYYSAKPPRATE